MELGMNGERLKEIRKDHGDTQMALAEKLGFSVSTIRKWEQGCCDPGVVTLIRICKLYDVSADYLLNLTNLDPFLYKRRQKQLSSESQNALKLFESYLFYQEDKD